MDSISNGRSPILAGEWRYELRVRGAFTEAHLARRGASLNEET